jgi:putative RecB family exonuclease
VRRHHGTTFASDRMETLAIEPRISLDLGGHAYTGFIDRLARDADGRLHVIDYKTSRSMPESFDAAGLQVRAYGVAVLEEHGGLDVGLHYEYLRHGRSLDETFTRDRSPDVAGALTRRIEGALAAELAGSFPARPSPLCRWCGFRDTCEESPFRLLVAPPVPATPRATQDVVDPMLGSCSRCGSPLRRRTSSRGDMIACSRYPDCRQARDAS